MELRWLIDPTTNGCVLQFRDRGDNGVYGPGYKCYDTGWTNVPEVFNETPVPTVTGRVDAEGNHICSGETDK